MITNLEIGYSGRLGNQMFQYATLFALQQKLGYKIQIPSHNVNVVKHNGCMDLGTGEWIPYKCDLYNAFDLTSQPVPKAYIYKEHIYQESKFTFEPEIFNIKDNTDISGYFQSYKYFDEYRNEILKELTFKQEIVDSVKQHLPKGDNIISVHIRRGDYVANPGFENLDNGYLVNAISKFDSDAEPVFLIFSDDIEYCKQIFGTQNRIFYSENKTPIQDMCLMSMCNHNIIANSSFSWWGAYLNQNPNKIVVAPSKWFTDGRSLEDLYPPNWIII
jgi:hypothetical protein